jgi:hypothetical protein
LVLPERYEKGDTLIIQKVHNPNELRKAQSQGAKVIFDIDDAYLHITGYLHMVQMADMVTVDSDKKKEYVREYTQKPIVVIPDCLDWDGITRTEDVRNGVACWTSYGNNAEFLEGVKIPYKLKLITTPNYDSFFNGECEFAPWSLDTVDEEIRNSEMMVIPLPDNEVTRLKGMHKLLKAWANGVPCYTSPMPDYVKAMQEAGVGDKYLIEDWTKLENIGFDERCREYALQYQAENIAKQWKKIL